MSRTPADRPQPNPRRVLQDDTTYLDEDGCLVVRRVVVLEDRDTGQLSSFTVEARPTVPPC